MATNSDCHYTKPHANILLAHLRGTFVGVYNGSISQWGYLGAFILYPHGQGAFSSWPSGGLHLRGIYDKVGVFVQRAKLGCLSKNLDLNGCICLELTPEAKAACEGSEFDAVFAKLFWLLVLCLIQCLFMKLFKYLISSQPHHALTKCGILYK